MPRRGWRLAPAGALTLSALTLTGGAAHAQVLQAPRRAADVTAPRTATTPLSTSLIVSATAFGGYDDNVSQGGEVSQPGAPPPITGAGGVGDFSAGVDYRRTEGRRGISFGAIGSGIVYGGIDLGASQTAGATFSAFTPLGRANTFTITEALNYQSVYGLESLGPIENPIETPGELPTGSGVEGVLQQRSWATDTGLSMARQWSRRDETTLGYNYNRRNFLGSNGETSESHAASAGYTRTLSRTAEASANYGYSSAEYAGSFTAGPARPVASHNVDGVFSFTRRVSPRRSLFVGFGGGASRVETVSTEALLPYTYWAPTGSFDARLDLSMTWTLSGNYRRTTTAFDGLNSETFVSDIGAIAVGGPIGDRLRLVLTGGAARGDVDAAAAGTGSYQTGTAAAQIDFRLTTTLSATVMYSYYRYSFSADTPLPAGVPQEFNRNAVRAGLSMALPLSGRQSRTRP